MIKKNFVKITKKERELRRRVLIKPILTQPDLLEVEHYCV